ncbi:MAG: L,D-transpeptidase [Hyphomicrobium sp.]|jgi:lipoprotein-anchoring transpeptidase ErfK/SrfK
MSRKLPLLLSACAALALLSQPAAAQSLSPFGSWDEDVQREGRVYRAPQAAPKSNSYGGSFFGFGPGPGQPFPAIMEGGGRPQIAGRAPPIVPFYTAEKPGTILIDNSKRRLYLVLDNDEAYEYPISVGRDGFTWTGTESISRVADWPDWHPPVEMRQRDPRLPEKMYGGIKNPLGVKALFLGNTLYRIHGTNDPKTIGYAASSGCFRMMNEHVVHLAALVNVGTTVKVMDEIPEQQEVASGRWQAKPSSLGGNRYRDADGDPYSEPYYEDENDIWVAR